ncbi:MAG: hypothetical protein WBJ83_06240 [Thermacetogeniaceae bacterium]
MTDRTGHRDSRLPGGFVFLADPQIRETTDRDTAGPIGGTG